MANPTDFADVKLLLRFDGSDNSTAFPDSSTSGRTVTRTNALVKAFASPVSASTGYFDGASDYLSVPDSPDFAFGAGNWTIEFWFRPGSVATTQYLIGRGINSVGVGNYPFNIYISAPGNIIGRVHDGVVDYSTPSGVMTAGVWKHIAFVRYNNALKLYVNGVATGAGVAITNPLVSATDAICIGNASVAYAAGAGAAGCANGYFDELRITKGQALYTGNFAVPTAAFPGAPILDSVGTTSAAQTAMTATDVSARTASTTGVALTTMDATVTTATPVGLGANRVEVTISTPVLVITVSKS